MLFIFRSKRKQRIRIRAADTEQHTLFMYVMLSKMPLGWRRGEELLNKVVLFVAS